MVGYSTRDVVQFTAEYREMRLGQTNMVYLCRPQGESVPVSTVAQSANNYSVWVALDGEG